MISNVATGNTYTGNTYPAGDYPYYIPNTSPDTNWVVPFTFEKRCSKCGLTEKDTKILSNGFCERCDAVEHGIPYEKLLQLRELFYIPFQSEDDKDG